MTDPQHVGSSKREPWWRGLVRFSLFSPRGFLICAAFFTIAFLACHLAGLREYTSILCGQLPEGEMTTAWAAHLGMEYVVFYFAFVLAVPVLALAAAILALFLRLFKPPIPESEQT